MALSAERKAQLAQMHLPSEGDSAKRLLGFLQISGMTQMEIAEAIGYSPVSIGHFLNGAYGRNHYTDGNSLALRAALKQYIDLYETTLDWVDVRSAHKTESFNAVCRAAWMALRSGCAYLVDGPPGTEKTFSLRSIEREINQSGEGRAVYVYARVGHSPQNFLRETATCAGIGSRGTIDQLLRKLRFFLGQQRRRVVLMVDEAQHLDHSGLEVLRQLLDLPPHFGVILAGSHDLTQRLSHWQMEQWRSRLRKNLYLNGPTKAEAHAILRAELGEGLTADDREAIIASCRATGKRMQMVHDKPVSKSFTYTSARDLFGAIDRAKEVYAATPIRKEGVA